MMGGIQCQKKGLLYSCILLLGLNTLNQLEQLKSTVFTKTSHYSKHGIVILCWDKIFKFMV